jgi:F-box protein 21
MDPFNSSEPVSLPKLEAQLKFITPTATPEQTVSYLSAVSARNLSNRAAHNILSSPSHDPGLPVHPINPNLATYAALFSLVILPSHPFNHPVQMRQHLAVLTQHFLEYFDLDIHLFETHVLPLAYALPDSRAYRNIISQLKESDHESRTPKYRSDERNAIVEYKVGQVFRHRRRGYLAVIYGWDHYCRMQEQWITMNQVDRLPRGRNQPFYNVLVEDESTRYVAQENVVLLSADEITEQHVNAFPIEIGKWFKRYDPDTGTFVSNVKDEYPEG